MTIARLLLLLLPLFSGILPVAERNRPSTSRLSRGPQQPSLAELAVKPDVREAAQEAIGQRRRVSVVRLAPPADALPSWAAAEALDVEFAQAARYCPQWVTASPMTVRRLVTEAPASTSISSNAAAEIAQRLSADELIFVGVEPLSGQADTIQIVVHHWGGPQPGRIIGRAVTEADRRTAVGELVKQLAPSLTSEAHQELAKPGTAVSTAHAAWAAAIDYALQAITSESEEQAQQLAARGLEKSQQALAADGGYVAASLTAASCLEMLGRDKEPGEVLSRTYTVRNEPLTDALTMLEFTADYHRLAKRDAAAAFDGYVQLLEIDPTYLPALWSLMENLAADSATGLSGEDEALLGQLAARVLLCHPHSRVSELITGRAE